MPIRFRERWTGKRGAAFLLVLLVAAIVWALETDSIIPSANPSAISCRDYKGHINALYELFPKDVAPPDRCAMTPPRCGPTGMLFNSDGMETYYYRSACYADLAQTSLDARYCDEVVERESMFFDGHYYSRDACLKRVARSRADREAPKIGGENVARIDGLTAQWDRQQNFIINLTLIPERPVPGFYAISAMAKLEGPATVFVALNPEHPAIAYDPGYDRLQPISRWILRLDSERIGPQLQFPVETAQLRDDLQRMGVGAFLLEVQLQFLESADGALADPAQPRGVYISQQAVRVDF